MATSRWICLLILVSMCAPPARMGMATIGAECGCDVLAAAHRDGLRQLVDSLFGEASGCGVGDLNGDALGTAADLVAFMPCVTQAQRFTETAEEAGVLYEHGVLTEPTLGVLRLVTGGVGAGDYDGDGWTDLYAIRHRHGTNLLFRNRGDGTFIEVGETAGVALSGLDAWSGPSFADVDGDGRLDLFVGSATREPVLFRNLGDGTFEDITAGAHFGFDPGVYLGAAFGDYDRDDDLDLYAARWGTFDDELQHQHLWRNDGDGTFTGATLEAGIDVASSRVGTPDLRFWTQTGTFADVNSDGWPDLLVVSDFNVTQFFRAAGDGMFTDATTAVFTDENGMGSAVGDYDNDGDLDWFVSSVYERQINRTGNRLYRNRGDGSFEDATEEAGVREGFWGWASCFADFDNDGNLDIFHVNGRGEGPRDVFWMKPARLFISQGDGTFDERAAELGIADDGEGLGIVCFDYDRDGDIDVFIHNVGQASRLYRNDGGNRAHFLQVELRGAPPNTEGIGARVYVEAAGVTQMREIRVSNNYVSQDPAMAHFGLGRSAEVESLRVRWPDGQMTACGRVAAGRRLRIDQQQHGCEVP
jgi:hypothetical protein